MNTWWTLLFACLFQRHLVPTCSNILCMYPNAPFTAWSRTKPIRPRPPDSSADRSLQRMRRSRSGRGRRVEPGLFVDALDPFFWASHEEPLERADSAWLEVSRTPRVEEPSSHSASDPWCAGAAERAPTPRKPSARKLRNGASAPEGLARSFESTVRPGPDTSPFNHTPSSSSSSSRDVWDDFFHQDSANSRATGSCS